jgi:hypothetical protein
MINLDKAIQQLRDRKEMVDRAINQLEELMKMPATDVGRSRRGRKSMDEAERLQVSARMKTYWENRRKQNAAG